MKTKMDLRVGIDIGCYRHSVAVGLTSGAVLEQFEIDHLPAGFKEFFDRIEEHRRRHGGEVMVAMEGYNGHSRPFDSMMRARSYRLFNVNNLKLSRFKEIFSAPAKTDPIDSLRELQLFQLQDQFPTAKGVLEEIMVCPPENEQLKRLTRRRRVLVNERTRMLNRLQSDIQSICPGLLEMTTDANNLWFLTFLTQRDDLRQLARLRESTVLGIPGIGKKFAGIINRWQKSAEFGDQTEYVGDMIIEDARRLLELRGQIKALEARCEKLMEQSQIAGLIKTMPGFATVCSSELAGEIGTIERFAKESSLAIYLGMAPLDNSSGKKTGAKKPRQVNRRAKAAMMIAVDKHRKVVPESQRYYEKKRAEGRKHNQAIRSLGRHLTRVIYSMLRQEREYEIRSEESVETT